MNLSPLSQRWITAMILIPPMVGGILLLPNIALGVLLALFIIAGAWEWAILSSLPRYGYVLFISVALILAWEYIQDVRLIKNLLFLSTIMWLFAIWIVWRYPYLPSWWRWRIFQAGIGFWILIPPWASLIALQGGVLSKIADGGGVTLFLFALIWVADSAAFFSGQKWGKNRLAPHVSPAKTWEGLYGAVIATLTITALGIWQFNIRQTQWVEFFILCIITLFASVLGDLFESVIKRTHGAKDSGALLPGHGGVLDRIDSLTAAAPIFTAGLYLLGN